MDEWRENRSRQNMPMELPSHDPAGVGVAIEHHSCAAEGSRTVAKSVLRTVGRGSGNDQHHPWQRDWRRLAGNQRDPKQYQYLFADQCLATESDRASSRDGGTSWGALRADRSNAADPNSHGDAAKSEATRDYPYVRNVRKHWPGLEYNGQLCRGI